MLTPSEQAGVPLVLKAYQKETTRQGSNGIVEDNVATSKLYHFP
jgi:hypothetical protein